MEFRDITAEDIRYAANNSISRSTANQEPDVIDYSTAITHEGKLLAIGGIRLINPTTAWAHLDLTCEAGSYMIQLYRCIRDWLDAKVKELKIIRLQAYCEVDFEQGVKLVQHLGFELESTMENFVGLKPAGLWTKFYVSYGDTFGKEGQQNVV